MAEYDDLDYAAKAIYHVKKAEDYQRQAERLENWADEHGGNPELAAQLLSDPHKTRAAYRYKVAVGTRNGHQQRAIMYSLIALLQRSMT